MVSKPDRICTLVFARCLGGLRARPNAICLRMLGAASTIRFRLILMVL